MRSPHKKVDNRIPCAIAGRFELIKRKKGARLNKVANCRKGAIEPLNQPDCKNKPKLISGNLNNCIPKRITKGPRRPMIMPSILSFNILQIPRI